MDGPRAFGFRLDADFYNRCLGLWNDNTGMYSQSKFSSNSSTEFMQELFTRVPPFHPSLTMTNVLVKILRGVPDRPSIESTFYRLTDEWWNLCLLCWKRDPSSRPSISDILCILAVSVMGAHERVVLIIHSGSSTTNCYTTSPHVRLGRQSCYAMRHASLRVQFPNPLEGVSRNQ